jgi:predicted ribosomally synthesized peptide with SipW-like signal peptide
MTISTRVKLLATAGLIGCAAAAAGLGTFGSFTSTTSASQGVQSGTVTIALGSAGTAANRLSVGATNIVPGDTIERQVQLSNSGTANLASVALSTVASPSSLLDTDTTNGLQLTVQSCPTAWTEAGTAPAYTYTCTGTATTVLASRPVIGSNLTLPALGSLSAGGVDHLMVTLSFPSTAPNTLQAQSSTVNFSFAGTQRTGQAG